MKLDDATYRKLALVGPEKPKPPGISYWGILRRPTATKSTSKETEKKEKKKQERINYSPLEP